MFILLTEGVLFTGTSATVAAAVYENRQFRKAPLGCVGFVWGCNFFFLLFVWLFAKGCFANYREKKLPWI